MHPTEIPKKNKTHLAMNNGETSRNEKEEPAQARRVDERLKYARERLYNLIRWKKMAKYKELIEKLDRDKTDVLYKIFMNEIKRTI